MRLLENKEELDTIEIQEWLDSMDYVLASYPPDQVRRLLRLLQLHAEKEGVSLPFSANTAYINTINRKDQPAFPGNREIERRIKSLVRWNAMAMVVRANKQDEGIGGHISPTPLPPHFMKSASTTSSVARTIQMAPIKSISRVTLLPVSTPGHI